MSMQSNKQPVHVPPYYFFSDSQEQKLWATRATSKRRLRSLLSRRAK